MHHGHWLIISQSWATPRTQVGWEGDTLYLWHLDLGASVLRRLEQKFLPTPMLFIQGRKRDVEVQDRDETETFGFQTVTRPRPRRSDFSRDRTETDTFHFGPTPDRDNVSETETFFKTLACYGTFELS